MESYKLAIMDKNSTKYRYVKLSDGVGGFVIEFREYHLNSVKISLVNGT